MNTSIKIIVIILCLSLNACVYTSGLLQPKNYKEKISSVYITENNLQLVVMTNDYHYIFDMPQDLENILNFKYKKYFHASFDQFFVDNDNIISGNIKINVNRSNDKDMPDFETEIPVDFLKKGGKTISLHGNRYLSNNIMPKASQHKLNETYTILIKEELSTAGAISKIPATPITLVQDTLYLGAVVLVILPIMALGG